MNNPALTEAIEIWTSLALEGRRKTTLHDYEQAKMAILQDIERRGIPAAKLKALRRYRRPRAVL